MNRMYPKKVTRSAIQVASGFFSLVSALGCPWGVQKKAVSASGACHLASSSLDPFS